MCPDDRIVFNDFKHGDVIAKMAGTAYDTRSSTVVSREVDGELVGGVLFTNFTGESIAMHTAGLNKHWLNRDLLYVIVDYPFNQLGVKRVFGLVPADNEHAQQLNTKFGGKVVARIEGMFRDNVAGIVMCLERDACRFMGVKPRRVVSSRH